MGHQHVTQEGQMKDLRDDVTYVRTRLDLVREDVASIKVNLAGFIGKVMGASAAVSILTATIVSIIIAII